MNDFAMYFGYLSLMIYFLIGLVVIFNKTVEFCMNHYDFAMDFFDYLANKEQYKKSEELKNTDITSNTESKDGLLNVSRDKIEETDSGLLDLIKDDNIIYGSNAGTELLDEIYPDEMHHRIRKPFDKKTN